MKYNQPAGAAADAPYLDGNRSAGIRGSIPSAAAIEHAQRELVHLIEFSGQTPNALDLTQVRQAIETLIAAATGGGDVETYLTLLQASARLPIFPEVQSSSGHFGVFSPEAGKVRIPAGVSFLHRGIAPHTSIETDLVTSPNKTYHLRWNSTDGFALKDLASGTYNPSVAAEGKSAFDSTFDDMLGARVVTSASNVVTVTNLINKDRLSAVFEKTTMERQSGAWSGLPFLSGALNWARTPRHIAIPQFSVDATSDFEAVNAVSYTQSRYLVTGQVRGYVVNAAVADRYISGSLLMHVEA